MTEENKYYNYIYLDPTKPGKYKYDILEFEYEPFYVGKGTGKRCKQHLYKSSGKFMKSKMINLKNNNIQPIIIKINEKSTNNFVCEYEKKLIKLIGRRDLGLGTLCNLRDGGEEGYGQICSEKTKKLKSLQNIGKKLSEEHKKKIGIANKGKISQKTRNAQKEYMKTIGYKLHAKPVYKIDLNNNILDEYESIKEASIKNKISITFIKRYCKNNDLKPKSINFKFKYKNG